MGGSEGQHLQVRVEGPAGGDWLQVTAASAEEARKAVRAVLMPGVTVEDVELVALAPGQWPVSAAVEHGAREAA